MQRLYESTRPRACLTSVSRVLQSALQPDGRTNTQPHDSYSVHDAGGLLQRGGAVGHVLLAAAMWLRPIDNASKTVSHINNKSRHGCGDDDDGDYGEERGGVRGAVSSTRGYTPAAAA